MVHATEGCYASRGDRLSGRSGTGCAAPTAQGNTPCSIRPRASSTALSPISVCSRDSGLTPPSEALGLWIQRNAAAASSNTLSARRTTRAIRLSLADSSGVRLCLGIQRLTRLPAGRCHAVDQVRFRKPVLAPGAWPCGSLGPLRERSRKHSRFTLS